VQQPFPSFDADDDRSLIENCGLKEARQLWDLGHSPQKTGCAVRCHVVFTFLICALATADRRQSEPAEVRVEPVDWQRWRCQLLEQTGAKGIVFAQCWDDIFHIAAFALLVTVKLKNVPPGIGTPQDVLAKYGLNTQVRILILEPQAMLLTK
jgi:hypothetical protein